MGLMGQVRGVGAWRWGMGEWEGWSAGAHGGWKWSGRDRAIKMMDPSQQGAHAHGQANSTAALTFSCSGAARALRGGCVKVAPSDWAGASSEALLTHPTPANPDAGRHKQRCAMHIQNKHAVFIDVNPLSKHEESGSPRSPFTGVEGPCVMGAEALPTACAAL